MHEVPGGVRLVSEQQQVQCMFYLYVVASSLEVLLALALLHLGQCATAGAVHVLLLRYSIISLTVACCGIAIGYDYFAEDSSADPTTTSYHHHSYCCLLWHCYCV